MKNRANLSSANADAAAPNDRNTLSGLKLLIALDALLVEGSIGRAAACLGIGAPAMSRLLAQIREQFDDPIFIRTGRGMVPTPFAESLRLRLRALSDEAEAILSTSPESDANAPESHPYHLSARPQLIAPPLAMRRHALAEGTPSPQVISRRLEELAKSNDPLNRLAKHIATIGAGAGRTRPLILEEADDAMSIILKGEADPIQVGALFVALQYRGATAAELAGLVHAVRREADCYALGSGKADLDWPAYPSPRRGTAPWFLIAAKLIAQSGRRVLLHGSAMRDPQLEGTLKILAIPTANSLADAGQHIQQTNIAFLPIDRLSPQLHGLLGLYHLFQMRSPLHRMVQLLNPISADASLLGTDGSASAEILREAAKLSGASNITILSTSRDAAQATPFRAMPLVRLENGEPDEQVIASVRKPPAEKGTGLTALEYLQSVWNGTARDDVALEIILATTTLALYALADRSRSWSEARDEAETLWRERR